MLTRKGVRVTSAMRAADRECDQHRWPEAIEILSSANRRRADARLEERILDLRRAGLADVQRVRPEPDWPADHEDCFEMGRRPPEVHGHELNGAVLGSAIQHHGALLVRECVGRDTAAHLLRLSEEAMDVANAVETGEIDDGSPWFRPFGTDHRDRALVLARKAARLSGALLLSESPRVLQQVVETYRSSGLGDVIADHLGEWPALSVEKSTIRPADATTRAMWHQDGAFLGAGIRTLNVWLSLTDSGVNAPGMEVFTGRLDHIVPTGTEGAAFEWSVGDSVVASYGTENSATPSFGPGDALLFDQMTLHRTHVTAGMTGVRHALETWFFAPSSFPEDQLPLLF